jgi:hypothetical protein
MPLQATSGAASQDGFGGGAAAIPNYIEDVFSTYLYTGNSSTQTITNGIDLSTKGGLVWTKARVDRYHNLEDTVRGAGNSLWSNATSANYYYSDAITAFGSTGYTLGADGTGNQVNSSPTNYVSWTFRKQPKFFDIVTWTGNDVAGRTISHSLGSAPGTIIVKRTNSTSNWPVYHRSLGATKAIFLNNTDAAVTSAAYWNNTEPTSTVFSIGDNGAVNEGGASAGTYIAYLFAHNAGGFGLTGSDNVISCGGFTTNGSGGVTVDLGYEPQWVFLKNVSAGYDSVLVDNMRGFPASGDAKSLRPEATSAEGNRYVYTNSTGFFSPNNLGADLNWIYIAIRRGPMKVPTSGTSVFSSNTATTNIQSSTQLPSAGFPVDLQIGDWRNGNYGAYATDRLRGGAYSYTFSTGAEGSSLFAFDSMTNVRCTGNFESSSNPFVFWQFRRAPSFFDEVCATCPSSGDFQVNHNLTVVPEFVITKSRSNSNAWNVYHKDLGRSLYLNLNDTVAQTTGTNYWNAPTTTTFGTPVGIFYGSGWTAVFYMFATAAGVSKVGSYTGTATTKQIDCGFTGGARFVLIKRTDSTSDWYVWDTVRGIVAGNDPYLLLNSNAAEVTNTDYIDTYSAGFEISSTAPAAINANGGSFIFLAIA